MCHKGWSGKTRPKTPISKIFLAFSVTRSNDILTTYRAYQIFKIPRILIRQKKNVPNLRGDLSNKSKPPSLKICNAAEEIHETDLLKRIF